MPAAGNFPIVQCMPATGGEVHLHVKRRKIFSGKIYLPLSLAGFFVIWFCAVAMCFSGEEDRNTLAKEEMTASAPREERIYLYFGDPGGRRLTGVARSVENPGDPAAFGRNLLTALIKGPGGGRTGSLIPVFDPDTEVLAVFIDASQTAYVDLKKNPEAGHITGVRQEMLSVYAIANTMIVNMDGVQRVRILLGGKEALTLSGHIDITRPVTAQMHLVR